jgi:hypothetical protein
LQEAEVIDGHAATSSVNRSTSFLNIHVQDTTIALADSPNATEADEAIAAAGMTTRINNDSLCTSPEYNVPWPLNGSIPSITTNSFSCGLSSNTTLSNFFKKLASELETTYAPKCQEAVRFGVAFGSVYMKKDLHPVEYLSRPCSIMFVLEEHKPNRPQGMHSFNMETLFPIPKSVLPYKNMRRNVKLFKLHSHLLFPWTNAVVWQDVKLKYIPSRPAKAFTTKLLKTNEGGNDKPCLVVMGLPRHYNAFGNDARVDGYQPKYNDHCKTVVNAMAIRPTVTDSADTLQQQCRFYQETAANATSVDLVPLHRGLIDSAFMIWNQDSQKCRDFNERLACSWSSEIQCFSDRDQISFPFILQQMGLRESAISKEKDGIRDSLFLVDKDDDVMVRIIGSHCHWYTETFPLGCY